MTGWLDGKRALVVGAGSGIGRAVVDAFLAEGARVAVLERDQDKCASATTGAIRGPCGRRGRDDPSGERPRLLPQAVNAFGGLDMLVNCVGIFDFYKGISDIDADDLDNAFDEMFRTNVLSHLHTVKAAMPALQAAERSSIVLTESDVGLLPRPRRGAVRLVEVRRARTGHHPGL